MSAPSTDGNHPATGDADGASSTQKTSLKDKILGLVDRSKHDEHDNSSSAPTADSSAKAETTSHPPPNLTMRAISPQRPLPPDHHARGTSSPPHNSSSHNMSIAVSPGRLRSASPGLSSPASSLIFERNVQETAVPEDLTSKLPAHIQTEDQIPAVLEASSIAITDGHLRPEEVEILTHSVHQPAGTTVTSTGGATSSSGLDSGAISPVRHNSSHEPTGLSSPGLFVPAAEITEDLPAPQTSYGSIDPTDVRRLSFISFADVVQSEHLEQEHHHARDNLNASGVLHMTLSETTANNTNGSPSPTGRIPASPGPMVGAPSPPTSGASSVRDGLDSVGMTKMTPSQAQPLNLPGSPVSLGQQSPALAGSGAGGAGGELLVEKMSEALRKSGGGESLPTTTATGMGEMAGGSVG